MPDPASFVATKAMGNPTPLKPRTRRPRSAAEVGRWETAREAWVASLDPAFHFPRLFDHLPGLHFFAKDRAGHLMFASRGLRERYSMEREGEILGMTDFDLNPDPMAESYVEDDRKLLSGAVDRIERVELWWDSQGMPDWFLVTKLPLRDRGGAIAGVMGLLRRPGDADRDLPVFQAVAKAVEILRREFATPLSVEEVARRCGQSVRQLQRRFQAAFGIPPQEFLMKTRVLAAQRQLESTSGNAAEIARRCGFVDASSFAQHFRRRLGMSPTAYRERMRKGRKEGEAGSD
jgi:AraC-like DNA-binding protein